jgi:hypothetical protein
MFQANGEHGWRSGLPGRGRGGRQDTASDD